MHRWRPCHLGDYRIAALHVDKDKPVRELSVLVRATWSLSSNVTRLTDIDDVLLMEFGVSLQEGITGLLEFVGDAQIHVFAHNGPFAHEVLGHTARQYGANFGNPIGSTIDLARLAWPSLTSYTIPNLFQHLRLKPHPTQAALDSAKATLTILQIAAKSLTGPGGRLSASLVQWGYPLTA